MRIAIAISSSSHVPPGVRTGRGLKVYCSENRFGKSVRSSLQSELHSRQMDEKFRRCKNKYYQQTMDQVLVGMEMAECFRSEMIVLWETISKPTRFVVWTHVSMLHNTWNLTLYISFLSWVVFSFHFADKMVNSNERVFRKISGALKHWTGIPPLLW